MPRKRAQLPIGVHSIGFPAGTSDFMIVNWLYDHDFPAPVAIIHPRRGKYTWARLRNVSAMFRYRTEHWNTSLGTVAVRFAIHKRRKPKTKTARRRRRGAANEERFAWRTSQVGGPEGVEGSLSLLWDTERDRYRVQRYFALPYKKRGGLDRGLTKAGPWKSESAANAELQRIVASIKDAGGYLEGATGTL